MYTEQLNASLAGRYTIERLVGEGGMATVYLARDVRHQRRVALKVLRPDLGAVVGEERFLSEIQVTANLQHPNLLPLFDSGAADGLLFYVMPFIDGETLRARLDREKQLPIEEAVRIASAVGSALDYAHRHGVIHRDLKPENILLHEGQPVVADFGIALAVSNAGGGRITQTGLSLGTPQYMSPEQATGDRAIDGRTDVFSLGAVTYEMLTGEPPHTGSTSQAIIARLLTERPRSIRSGRPNVPDHVAAAVECALEKLPADRWATAREFIEALTGARIVTRPTNAATELLTPAGGRPTRRRPAVRELAAWGTAVAALGALAFVALTKDRARALRTAPAEFVLVLPDSLEPGRMGTAGNLAISRDGRTIVFQGMRPGGSPALYARFLDDPVVQQIRGTDSALSPTISPDGSEILFSVIGTPGLRRVSIRGGSPRQVVDSASTNSAVAWGDHDELVLTVSGTLYRAPAAGGARILLAAPDSGRGHGRYVFPSMLPGGTAALITIGKRDNVVASAELGLVTIPEGEVRELGIIGSSPRYSPTGHIVYATIDGIMFAVPFDVRRRRVTGAPFPLAENVRVGVGGAAGFAVANDGTIVLAQGQRASEVDRTLVAVSRTGIERPLGAGYRLFSHPQLSPDGGRIAVSIASTVGPPALRGSDVWRFDIEAGGALERVTTDSASMRPRWSRDGDRIAFVRPTFRSDSTVMWRPLYAAAQSTILIRAPHPISDLALSPTGGYSAIKIAIGSDGSEDIWLVHPDSLTAPRPFLSEPYTEKTPRISPDGALLAYVTNRTGRDEVYIRRILGGGGEVLVSAGGATEPLWARTGLELFYRTSDSVVSARIETEPRLAVTGREALFADAYARHPTAGNYDVFPNGREFVVVKIDNRWLGQAPLIVLINWHQRSRAPSP